MALLGFGKNLATFSYADQGVQAQHNDATPARISNIVKWAMLPNRADNPALLFNAPVIDLGQLNWAFNSHLVRTAQGQGRYSYDRR